MTTTVKCIEPHRRDMFDGCEVMPGYPEGNRTTIRLMNGASCTAQAPALVSSSDPLDRLFLASPSLRKRFGWGVNQNSPVAKVPSYGKKDDTIRAKDDPLRLRHTSPPSATRPYSNVATSPR